MSFPEPSDDLVALKSLFATVRLGILDNPSGTDVFFRIVHQQTPGAASGVFPDQTTISAYFATSTSLPSPTISPPRYIATPRDADCTTPSVRNIIIHHSITQALASDPCNPLLRFLVIVSIVHALAHNVRTRFICDNFVLPTPGTYPYHTDVSVFYQDWPEAGFFAEEAFFGGIVGVVFHGEVFGEPRASFFDLDFSRIAHLFLHCPNGGTYLLDSDVLARKLSSGLLTPFDCTKLKTVVLPSPVVERTCAMLNSTHIPRRNEVEKPHPDEQRGVTCTDDWSESDEPPSP